MFVDRSGRVPLSHSSPVFFNTGELHYPFVFLDVFPPRVVILDDCSVLHHVLLNEML